MSSCIWWEDQAKHIYSIFLEAEIMSVVFELDFQWAPYGSSLCRYLELESSGHRNEVRLHYRSGSHRPHTEVFPYILADDKWHKLSLAISASHLTLHIDCNK